MGGRGAIARLGQLTPDHEVPGSVGRDSQGYERGSVVRPILPGNGLGDDHHIEHLSVMQDSTFFEANLLPGACEIPSRIDDLGEPLPGNLARKRKCFSLLLLGAGRMYLLTDLE
jgi:hypothetical protein